MIIRFLSILFISVMISCNPQNSCEENTDTQNIIIQSFTLDSKYPEFPENKYPLGTIDNIYVETSATNIEYDITNEVISLNGEIIDESNPDYSGKAGVNTVEYTSDCVYGNKNQKMVCDCNSNMTSVTKEFEMIDTARVWLKRIEFNRQYQSQGIGGKPNVYLELDNFSKKSPVTANYDRASMGNLVWEIDDTLTISDLYFNLDITVWDRDQFSADDILDEYMIYADDINNWTTGIDTVSIDCGYFVFEIERL